MSPMFVPGPVDVATDVLQQQTRPMIPHRSKDFEAIFQRSIEKLRQVFYTQYRVFIMTNSGSGAQEASVRNLAQSPMTNYERLEYDQSVARLHAMVADEEFSALWAEGGLLTIDKAIELALR